MDWNDPDGEAKKGAKRLADNLTVNDKSALISFESSADMEQNLTLNKELVKNAADGLSYNGGTDMGSGMKMANDELLESERARADADKVMVVLGDGDVNPQAVSEAQRAHQEGIRVIAIAFTGSVDSDITEINSTEDDYYEVQTADELENVFDEIGRKINEDYIRESVEAELFGGEIGQVEANGTVRFNYDASDYITSTVSLYRWNNSLEGEEPQGWELIQDQANGGTIEAQVESFSTFAVFGQIAPPSDPEDSSGEENSGGSIDISDSSLFEDEEEETSEDNQQQQDTGDEEIDTDETENDEQQGFESGEDTGQDTGQDQPQGPTGLFAAGTSNFVQSIVGFISNLLPF